VIHASLGPRCGTRARRSVKAGISIKQYNRRGSRTAHCADIDLDRRIKLKTLPFIWKASTLALTISLHGLAQAQEASASAQDTEEAQASGGVGEIIVTAQRREQSVLDVPIAITAVSGASLQNAGISDSSQLAATVPNLQINSAYGKTQPNFSLRGIGVGNEYSANQASPIGVYVDDAYIASRTSQGAQLYDLERVEVLRGPQGTLFGRNTTGGAINIITRKPDLEGTNGYAEASYGTFNAVHLQGAVETTLVDDVLGLRVAANFDRTDPTFDNLIAGIPGPNGGKSFSGRALLRWKPSSRFDVLLKAYGSKDILTQGALHSIGATPTGVNPLTGYSRAGLDFYDVEYGYRGRRRTNSYGVLGSIKFEASDNVTLYSLTSYDGGFFLVDNDADAQPLSLLNYNPTSHTRQFNQELRANMSFDRLDLVMGGYYGSDRTRTENFLGLYYFLRDLGAPADPTGATGGFSIVQNYTQDRQSKALFAQADYQLTDQLTVTGGLRYTWDKSQLRNALSYFGDYDFNPLVYTVTDPNNYGQPVPTLRESDGALTGRVAVNYKFDSGMLVYASYNHGYRAGTFNGGAYASVAQLDYVEPEIIDAYEVGAKGRLFDRALTYSLAAFYYDYKNQQTNEVINFTGFLRNAGSARVYGAELELNGYFGPNLTMHASIGLLNTKYKQLILGRDVASGTIGVDLAGNELPFAPKLSMQFGADWTVANIGNGRLRLLPEVSYVSRQWFSPFNDRESFPGDPIGNGRLQQKGYAKVDGQLLWDNEKLTVGLYVKNLFEKHYYSYGLDLRTFFGLDFLAPADPRTFGVLARVNF
jgi:iron complex outermembrane receptor protein